MKSFLSLILVMITLGACSKNSTAKDNELPVITITSPASNQVFSAGEMVNITGTLSDNQKLTEVHVHISNSSTGTLLIDIHRYPAAATYNLNESFQAQAGINYKIQVIAKDNSANENHATVEITSN
ncbi:MAG: Ig-like domain-containing protein [Chitinophagaceae bacterium]